MISLKTIQEDMLEEFYKYMGWVSSSGIHGKELYKAVGDFWLSKFSSVLEELQREIVGMETTPAKYADKHWRANEVPIYETTRSIGYNIALSDILELIKNITK
jgi:hypothetical protein